jgi:hypothetical protein
MLREEIDGEGGAGSCSVSTSNKDIDEFILN